MSIIHELREANVFRDAEWDTSPTGLDGSFFGNELAGEVGEAIEVLQHLLYVDGSAGKIHLGEELADVVICVDLLALKFNILVDEPPRTYEWFDIYPGILDLAKFTGRACNITKKLERERLGLVGSRATIDELAEELTSILRVVRLLAIEFGISLDRSIVEKFNKTSDKCGLKTKMVLPS